MVYESWGRGLYVRFWDDNSSGPERSKDEVARKLPAVTEVSASYLPLPLRPNAEKTWVHSVQELCKPPLSRLQALGSIAGRWFSGCLRKVTLSVVKLRVDGVRPNILHWWMIAAKTHSHRSKTYSRIRKYSRLIGDFSLWLIGDLSPTPTFDYVSALIGRLLNTQLLVLSL